MDRRRGCGLVFRFDDSPLPGPVARLLTAPGSGAAATVNCFRTVRYAFLVRSAECGTLIFRENPAAAAYGTALDRCRQPSHAQGKNLGRAAGHPYRRHHATWHRSELLR